MGGERLSTCLLTAIGCGAAVAVGPSVTGTDRAWLIGAEPDRIRNSVHPSVYFLLETYPQLGIQKSLRDLEGLLQQFRVRYSPYAAPDARVHAVWYVILLDMSACC